MEKTIFKLNVKTKEITNITELKKLGIYEQIMMCFNENYFIENYTYKNEQNAFYIIKLLHTHKNWHIYTVEQNQQCLKNKKGKYSKVEIKKKKIKKIVNEIGLINSQKIHAVDYSESIFVNFRKYLKSNPNGFPPKYLFEKDFSGAYNIVRHKNLFSAYGDEISDFEKLTTIEKMENGELVIGHILDEDVMQFNDQKLTIQDRKFMREFAKDIYTKKGKYKQKEVFELLKNKDLFVEEVKITPKEHREIWSKVSIDEMDIRILEKNRNEFKCLNVPNNKKRKYLSKRDKKRKLRRNLNNMKNKELQEFYEFYN